jgi:UDP-N-acetylglucosamine 2-epimerase (non-hydrolysing)
MKVAIVFGTRPEIIRFSRVIPALEPFCELTLVHTGQNYDERLSEVFFRELGVRAPDVHFGIRSSGFAEQAGQILQRTGEHFTKSRPDRLLVLGDTNSGLAAIIAARMRIPVYHMEAGNRCYDDRVPEEINRRLIDHSSDVLMPYTQRSKENLVREGIARERIFVTGNPINEVLTHYAAAIDASGVLARLRLAAGGFFLVTLHRAENVDLPERLDRLMTGLARVADTFSLPLVVSLHPRTADRLESFGLAPGSDRVRLLPPLGFADFVHLEQRARCVLSDSGTVQEECAIFRVPSVTLRDVTERPETIEAGSNVLTGDDPDTIVRMVRLAVESPAAWTPPEGYLAPQVSTTVAKIVLGYDYRPA